MDTAEEVPEHEAAGVAASPLAPRPSSPAAAAALPVLHPLGDDAARAEEMNVGERVEVAEAEEAAREEGADEGGERAAAAGSEPPSAAFDGSELGGAALCSAVLALFASSPPAFLDATAPQISASLAQRCVRPALAPLSLARGGGDASRLKVLKDACEALVNQHGSVPAEARLLCVASPTGHRPCWERAYVWGGHPAHAEALRDRLLASAAAARAAQAAEAAAARVAALRVLFGPGGAMESSPPANSSTISRAMLVHLGGGAGREAIIDGLEVLRAEGFVRREAGGLYCRRRERDPDDESDDDEEVEEEEADEAAEKEEAADASEPLRNSGAVDVAAAAAAAAPLPPPAWVASPEEIAAASAAAAASRAAADAAAAAAVVAHTYDDVGDGTLLIVGGYSAAEEAPFETSTEAKVRSAVPQLFDPNKPLYNRSATAADIVTLLATDRRILEAVATRGVTTVKCALKTLELVAATVLRRMVASGSIVAFEVGIGFRGGGRRAIRYCPPAAHRDVRAAEAEARGPDAATLRAEARLSFRIFFLLTQFSTQNLHTLTRGVFRSCWRCFSTRRRRSRRAARSAKRRAAATTTSQNNNIPRRSFLDSPSKPRLLPWRPLAPPCASHRSRR